MTGLSNSAEWINSIGTVFTDTLWQGILIGASFSIGILFLKPGDARSRYNIAVVALLALILWTGYDLVHAIQHFKQFKLFQTGIYSNLLKENSTLSGSSIIPADVHNLSGISGLFYALYSSIGRYYTLIAPAWIFGILILSIRMAGGWIAASRLRNQDVFMLPSSWYSCVESLNNKLRISQQVGLKGSYKVSGPMVIGYFRPVILVPAAVICGLSYSEMETILAHELAHVNRHDFLIICLQHVAETLLFYHPVTWLISSFLDKEREKCCDDIAVALTNNSLPFAKAITLMENNRVQKNMPAAFLVGHRNNLLLRIKRILDKGIRKSSFIERFAAAAIIITGLFIVFAFSGFTYKKSNGSILSNPSVMLPPKNNNTVQTLPDSLKKYRETRTIEADLTDDSTNRTSSYKITYENDSVKDLYVNKKKISRDQLDEFRNKIDEIRQMSKEDAWNKEFSRWNAKKELKDLLDMSMQQSKHAMEEAMLELQLTKDNLKNEFPAGDVWMKQQKMFKELQNKQQEQMLKNWLANPGDSCFLYSGDSRNYFFPKMNEKEAQEMQRQMEKLQKQIGEQMRIFQEEFQKNHGKMMDSLKREMEKLQKSMPFWQNGAFLNSWPAINMPDVHFENAFLMHGQHPDLWKPDVVDTSEMENKLRNLEK